MKKLSISHISHGIAPTGGFRHEQFLLQQLSSHFKKNNIETEEKTIRANRFFSGLSQLKLLLLGFKKSTANINIVVARTALSAVLRNLFNQNKIIIVVHYFDKRDGKNLALKCYYACLFFILRNFTFKNISVVAVAPFWVTYFENKVNKNVPVFLFPNFFEVEKYTSYHTQQKPKQIHLGQYSFKNSKSIFELAKQLSLHGYRCYFSTMIKQEVGQFDGYDVVFEDYESYLINMSQSLYTLAFIGINEGWNRVAHESILVGTTLIGNDAGGLGDLIKESGSLLANDAEQFKQYILNQHQSVINKKFVERYDVNNATKFLQPIIDFILR